MLPWGATTLKRTSIYLQSVVGTGTDSSNISAGQILEARATAHECCSGFDPWRLQGIELALA